MYMSTRSPRSRGSSGKYDTTDEVSYHQTSYSEYPRSSRYLFHDDVRYEYATTPPKSKTGVPESSSRAVISALRDLQGKIRRMEHERTAAEQRLRNLSSETTEFKSMLHSKAAREQSTNTEFSKDTQELKSQLRQAESRCQSVEKQLEYMRKLVQRAEEEKNSVLKQQELTEAYTERARESELRSKQQRLNELEMERERLKATQIASEGKIRGLEDQVREEMHQRKLVQDKAAELQTAAQTNRILLEAELSKSQRAKKQPKKNKSSPSCRSQTVTPKQCSLKMQQIPFVAGKSTTPSHSIHANFQSVLAMMKLHHPAWCEYGLSSPVLKGQSKKKWPQPKRSLSVTSISSDSDLSDLLQGLQDEFAKMGIEHHELAKQIQEAKDSNLIEDLERELDLLVTKMEFKGDQIARLKRHKEKLSERHRKRKTSKRPSSARPSPGNQAPSSSDGAEVEVLTTVKTRGKGAGAIKIQNIGDKNKNLKILKDIQALRTSLRKDDISWD